MKNKILTSSSIIAAVFASLCCIGPLVLIGFGIGSVAFFSRFDEFRPYLVLASIILLAPAFYFTYRKREVKCEDGSCKIESVGKWNKISVWFAVLIVSGIIAFPYLGFAKSGHNIIDNPNSQTVVLKVNNMDCESCALGLQSQLKNISGVNDANVNFVKANAKINYDSSNQ